MVVEARGLTKRFFAACGMAFTCFIRSWQDLDLLQLVVLPLFLCSAKFHPLSTYGPAARTVVRATPLYRGVDRLGGLSLGAPGTSAVIDVVCLLAMGSVGVAVTSRRLLRLLLR